jgi:hypothetical protein
MGAGESHPTGALVTKLKYLLLLFLPLALSGQAGMQWIKGTPPGGLFSACVTQEFGYYTSALQTIACMGGWWTPMTLTLSTIGAGSNKLPTAAAANANWVTVVTDASSASDCTTGSGTSRALCISTGSAWVALGGGGGGTVPNTADLLIGGASNAAGDSGMSTTSPYSATAGAATQWKAIGLGFGLSYASTLLTDFTQASTSGSVKLGTAASLWSMSRGRLEETATLVSASSTVTAVTACLGPVATPCALTPGGIALLGTAGQFTLWGPASGAANATATQDIYLTLTVANVSPGNLGVSGLSVSACTNANPAVCTVTAHGFKSGSAPTVTIAGGTGSWAALNGTYAVAYASASTLTMTGINSTAFGALAGTITLAGSYIQAGQVTARVSGGVAQ